MSYTDPEDPPVPTTVQRAAAVIEKERGFILDVLLLVIVAIALATAYGIWPFVGLAALMVHSLYTYRGR